MGAAAMAWRDCLRKRRRAVRLPVRLFDMRSCFRVRYQSYTLATWIGLSFELRGQAVVRADFQRRVELVWKERRKGVNFMEKCR